MAGLSATYVDSDTFTVSDDQTDIFITDRRVKLNCGADGIKYASVVSSSYSAPNTTVNIDETVLTSNLSEVWYGIVSPGTEGSLPDHNHDGTEGTGGQLDHTNLSNIGTNTHAQLDTFKSESIQMRDDEEEPTGFVNRTNSYLSWDDSTMTMTVSGTFDYYIHGVKYSISSPATKTITDTEGMWYFYFDNTSTLQATQTVSESLFTNNALCTFIYWDADNDEAIYHADERHGMTMAGNTHYYLHTVFGCQFASGLALGNMTVDGDGNVDSSAQFSISDGVIFDEDIKIDITDDDPQNLSPIAYLPVYYLEGSTHWRKDTATAFPVKRYGTGRLAWNEYTGGAWQQTEVTNGDFVLCHIFATNDINNPMIAIQGQSTYTTVGNAREGAADEIHDIIFGGVPFEEITAIATVIYQTRDNYSNTVKARIRSTDTGDDYVDFRGSHAGGTGTTTNDHGNLSGLGDDDHLQYILVDGTRGFTGTVSGVSPVLDNDLVTKNYVDSKTWSRIEEGNSYVDVDDTGIGSITLVVDGNTKGYFDDTNGFKAYTALQVDNSSYVASLIPAANTVFNGGSSATSFEFKVGGKTTLYQVGAAETRFYYNATEEARTQSGSFKITNGLQIGTSTVMTDIKDEDDMASNSATALVTQQSSKAYTDNSISTHSSNADAHHPQSHTIASHSDTSATGAQLNTLTDGSNADSLHTHSASTPAAHAASHENNGSDEINVDGLSGLLADDQHVLDTEVDARVTFSVLNTNGDVGTGASQVAKGDHTHSGVYEPADATILKEADVDDTPVNGATVAPVSSNWAYDHKADANAHHAESHTIASHSDTSATGAELNTLTGGGDTTLHYHANDRARANHTGTQTASTISDFDTEVSNNSDVSSNTSSRHNRSHTMTSTSDHSAGNYKMFYSDGSGNIQELTHGASTYVLTSNGTSSAPSWQAASGGSSDKIEEGDSSVEVIDTGTGQVKTTVDGTEVANATSSTYEVKNANLKATDGLIIPTSEPSTLVDGMIWLA